MTLAQTQKLIHQTKGGRLKLTLERPPKPVSSKSRAGSHYESALSLYDSSSDYNRIRSGSSGYSVSLQNLREANRAGSRLDIRLVHSQRIRGKGISGIKEKCYELEKITMTKSLSSISFVFIHRAHLQRP